jgi:hypothetical protein
LFSQAIAYFCQTFSHLSGYFTPLLIGGVEVAHFGVAGVIGSFFTVVEAAKIITL